jgi:hypothetical protein
MANWASPRSRNYVYILDCLRVVSCLTQVILTAFEGSIIIWRPITVATRYKAWTVFARSNTVIIGSDPAQNMHVCIVCIYSVFVLSCVQVATLRWADPPSKESYRLSKKSNWKSSQGPTKGCRAIDILLYDVLRPYTMWYRSCSVS